MYLENYFYYFLNNFYVKDFFIMRFKKISILVMAVAFLFPNLAKADDVFLDNNAISEFSDANSSIVISEYNTGKIISKRGENEKVSVNKLPNYLALYLLTDDLKNKKTSLDDKITINKGKHILWIKGSVMLQKANERKTSFN